MRLPAQIAEVAFVQQLRQRGIQAGLPRDFLGGAQCAGHVAADNRNRFERPQAGGGMPGLPDSPLA